MQSADGRSTDIRRTVATLERPQRAPFAELGGTMSDETPEAPASTTRRDLIKKAGVGAAVVWTAPMVMSLGSVAAAASPGGVACSDCRNAGVPCDVAHFCGPQGSEFSCFCFVKADGSGNCCTDAFNFCSDRTVCGPGNTCPPGYTCIATCCAENVCVAPCGSDLPPLATQARGFGAQIADESSPVLSSE